MTPVDMESFTFGFICTLKSMSAKEISLCAATFSRAAIRAAIAAGYGIEIDLQLSRDGVPMVFHDETLERLTPPQRLIVGLHYLEDFDLAEIEQVTGLARGTIKSHLHRARQVLKQELTRRAAAGELL